MENGIFYIGTQLKLDVSITGDGFDQDDGNQLYTIILKCGGEEKEYDQDDLVEGGNAYYLLVDTKDFAPGVMTATIIADVADDEFTTRKEIYVLDVCLLRSVP